MASIIPLSKTNGLTLIDHTKSVLNVAMHTASATLSPLAYQMMADNIALAAILHDIGKCTTAFQQRLLNPKKKSAIFIEHSVYSLVFFATHIQGGNENSIVCTAILHHHAINHNNDMRICDIQYSDEEINVARQCYLELYTYAQKTFGAFKNNEYALLDKPLYNERKITDYGLFFRINRQTERWRNNADNEACRLLMRSIILFADRTASSLTDEHLPYVIDNNVEFINSLISQQIKFHYSDIGTDLTTIRSLYDASRYDQQCEVLNEVDEKRNLIIPATAGYGKTLIGLLWAIKTRMRTMWVVPRNTLAFSTYQSINSELRKMRIDKINVGLYYGGNFIYGDGNSDIIVTNIDSVLNKNIRNNRAKTLWNTFANNMIFDEYHELCCDEALFSGFIRLVYARKNFTKSSMLLLSATPIDLSVLWGNENIATYSKPEALRLYDDMKMNIHMVNTQTPYTIGYQKDSFVIFPFVSWSQDAIQTFPHASIIHARFTREDRQAKESCLIKSYGKHANVEDKGLVIGTMIIGVGLDISAHNIYDFCITPEDAIQRGCGRGGRFNEDKYNGTIDYYCCSVTNPQYLTTYEKYIKSMYNQKLHDKWIEVLSQYDGQTITKGEMYGLYYDFYETYKRDIVKWLFELFEESDSDLTALHMARVNVNQKGRTKRTISGVKTFRNNDTENIFITTKDGSDNWIDPIAFNKDYLTESNGNPYDGMRQEFLNICINQIDGDEDEKADLKRYIRYGLKMKNKKHYTIDNCAKLAWRSDMPLPLFNAYYNSEIGLKILNDD